MHASRSHPKQSPAGPGGPGIGILNNSPPPAPPPQVNSAPVMPPPLKTSTGQRPPPSGKLSGRKHPRLRFPSECNPHEAAQGPASAEGYSRWQPPPLSGEAPSSNCGNRGEGVQATSRSSSRPPAVQPGPGGDPAAGLRRGQCQPRISRLPRAVPGEERGSILTKSELRRQGVMRKQ